MIAATTDKEKAADIINDIELFAARTHENAKRIDMQLKINDTYFATTKDSTIPVLVTNQDNLFAYCTILAGDNVGEEISLRKEHTTFKKKSKAK